MAEESTWNTLMALPPLTAREPAPGPVIVRFWEIAMVAARLMVAQGGERAKVMVSPGLALATSKGREPMVEGDPEQLVTMSVAALATWAGMMATEKVTSTRASPVVTIRRPGRRPTRRLVGVVSPRMAPRLLSYRGR